MKKLFLLASLLMAFGISADAGDITSPNGQIKVNFTLDGTVPTYSVTYQGKTIIKPSRLGYKLAKGGKDGKDLLADFSVINEKTSTFDVHITVCRILLQLYQHIIIMIAD